MSVGIRGEKRDCFLWVVNNNEEEEEEEEEKNGGEERGRRTGEETVGGSKGTRTLWKSWHTPVVHPGMLISVCCTIRTIFLSFLSPLFFSSASPRSTYDIITALEPKTPPQPCRLRSQS